VSNPSNGAGVKPVRSSQTAALARRGQSLRVAGSRTFDERETALRLGIATSDDSPERGLARVDERHAARCGTGGEEKETDDRPGRPVRGTATRKRAGAAGMMPRDAKDPAADREA